MLLWGLRLVLVGLMLFVVFYALNSEVEGWCHDEYSRAKTQWDRIVYNLTDESYTIPEAQRQPALSMKEFYAVPDRGLMDLMMRTRLTFKSQNHIGTVMRDGFHIDLPENTMWRGGVLVSGEDVRRQMELARQPAHPPAPPPPPHTSSS